MESKGIVLNVWRFEAEKEERISFVYRATDEIEIANQVIKPFLEARKEIARKELEGFEASVTFLEKAACAIVENHPRALQEWEGCSWFRKMLSVKPPRPSDEAVAIYKRVTDKRSELNSRFANPLVDLVQVDGEAMLKALLEKWAEVGFKVLNRDLESNGEFVKEVIELTYDKPATV